MNEFMKLFSQLITKKGFNKHKNKRGHTTGAFGGKNKNFGDYKTLRVGPKNKLNPPKIETPVTEVNGETK